MKAKNLVKFTISALLIFGVAAFIIARTPVSDYFGLNRKQLWG